MLGSHSVDIANTAGYANFGDAHKFSVDDAANTVLISVPINGIALGVALP
jgi:hypothetical protein